MPTYLDINDWECEEIKNIQVLIGVAESGYNRVGDVIWETKRIKIEEKLFLQMKSSANADDKHLKRKIRSK